MAYITSWGEANLLSQNREHRKAKTSSQYQINLREFCMEQPPMNDQSYVGRKPLPHDIHHIYSKYSDKKFSPPYRYKSDLENNTNYLFILHTAKNTYQILFLLNVIIAENISFTMFKVPCVDSIHKLTEIQLNNSYNKCFPMCY